MDVPQILALVLSVAAASFAAFAYLRGAPARLDLQSENAERIATRVAMEFDAFKAEATTILGAIQDERDRSQKAAARASATASRARMAEPENHGPQTRDEQLTGLRKAAGLL